MAIVPCCVAEQPYIGRQNGGLEVFNPQFIVSSIISRTSLLGVARVAMKVFSIALVIERGGNFWVLYTDRASA